MWTRERKITRALLSDTKYPSLRSPPFHQQYYISLEQTVAIEPLCPIWMVLIIVMLFNGFVLERPMLNTSMSGRNDFTSYTTML